MQEVRRHGSTIHKSLIDICIFRHGQIARIASDKIRSAL
jgi:hypothetical protein